jgi:hypothetical protein
MNRNKLLAVLILSIVGVPAYAQGVIYKCVDANGDISYSSDANSNRCEKTNLGKIDKGNSLNKPASPTNNSFTNVSVAPTVNNTDQIVRDQKRIMILQGELSQEKNLLKTVLDMIAKADSSDGSQVDQLKKMELTHKRNIASLEKELGVKGQLPANPPAGLPLGLPKGAEQVELVQAPIPPANNGRANTIQQQSQIPNTVAKNVSSNIQVAPASPYILINPSATVKTVTNNSVAAVAANPTTQIIQPEIIKEYREPAAITNKSLKKKISPALKSN